MAWELLASIAGVSNARQQECVRPVSSTIRMKSTNGKRAWPFCNPKRIFFLCWGHFVLGLAVSLARVARHL